MKQKPNLPLWSLWNLSFGFFGVQIAYALQSANISRIFRTLGADPHDLSFFWILPPLMGILVQPIVGTACQTKPGAVMDDAYLIYLLVLPLLLPSCACCLIPARSIWLYQQHSSSASSH